MAKQWELQGGLSETIWYKDIKNYLVEPDNKFISFSYVNTNYHIQWNLNTLKNKSYINYNLREYPDRFTQLLKAQKSHKIIVTEIMKLFNGAQGFLIIAPLYPNNNFVGFLVAAVDANHLFQQLFHDSFNHDFGIAVYQGAQPVYATTDRVADSRFVSMKAVSLKDVNWQVFTWPTKKLLGKLTSSSPNIMLISGIVLSFLVLVISYYYNQARSNAWRMLEAKRQALKFSERLERVLGKINEGCVIIDDNFKIVYWNTYLERLSGWQCKEVLGKNIFDVFIPEKNRDYFKQNFKLIFNLNQPELFNKEMELNTVKRDGTITPVEIISTPIEEDNEIYIYTFVRDVSLRRLAEVDQARLAAIVDTSKDAILSMDMKGLIITWNQGAEKLYGYKLHEVYKKPVSFLFASECNENLKELLLQLKEGQHVTYNDTQRKHKDGHIIPVSDTISPIYNKKNNIIGAASITRDITESKQVDKMKNEFISVVSHELRTPLTSIRGSLSLLAGEKLMLLTEQAKKLVHIAIQNCERLIRLINDILDIEKIEANLMIYKFACVQLNDLVSEAIDFSREIADKHNVNLKLIAKERYHAVLDHDRIMQVMVNLLSNAIRYAEKNSDITVTICRKGQYIRVAVNNYGPVIPESFHCKIFTKFSQADSSDSRQKGGTGLGLNICKAIINHHHGKIDYQSSEVEGTTFYFDLPADN